MARLLCQIANITVHHQNKKSIEAGITLPGGRLLMYSCINTLRTERQMDDLLHSALKTEEIGRLGGPPAEFVLMKLQHNKNDVSYSLHVLPSQFTLSGIQITDVLAQIGFKRGGCPFFPGGQCFVKEVKESFELVGFKRAFSEAQDKILKAARYLQECGIFLEQTEGWSFFTGGSKRSRSRRDYIPFGDGHISPTHKRMKAASDEYFDYVFTWIAGGEDKGWTTHLRVKHQPPSLELISALSYLGLRTFSSCPEFEFEQCHWRFAHFEEREDGFMDNAEYSHKCFDSLATHFSPGIEDILAAQSLLQPFQMAILPGIETNVALERIQPPRARTKSPKVGEPSKRPPFRYDVAISYAGTEQGLAESLAKMIRDAGYEVFFDKFFPAQLWGKDLPAFFDKVYRLESRFCVIFVSREYLSRIWTNHERQCAIARLLDEKGKEYILPIKVDNSDLPGLPPTIGYISLDEFRIDQLGPMVIRKIQGLE